MKQNIEVSANCTVKDDSVPNLLVVHDCSRWWCGRLSRSGCGHRLEYPIAATSSIMAIGGAHKFSPVSVAISTVAAVDLPSDSRDDVRYDYTEVRQAVPVGFDVVACDGLPVHDFCIVQKPQPVQCQGELIEYDWHHCHCRLGRWS